MGKTAQKQHQKEKPKYDLFPKCNSRVTIHHCIRVKHNNVVYGENGYFMVCTSDKCDYRERKTKKQQENEKTKKSQLMSKTEKNKKRDRKHSSSLAVCKHDFAYGYWNQKEKEIVYCCTKCGKWLYQ